MKIDIQEIFSGQFKLQNIPHNCVAICGAAIRTERWLDLYNFFKKTNDCNFIFIFCGHVVPDFDLPENFYFIESKEKNPAACGEICLRVAKKIPEVSYLLSIPDDCYFSEHALDKLLLEFESVKKDELIEIGMGFWGDIDANEKSALPLLFHNSNLDSPSLTMCGMRSKETCNKIGSIDKTFKGQYWDVDRTMRLLSMGGKIKTLSHLKVIEMPSSHNSHLLGPRFYNHDRGYLDLLWSNGNNDCNKFRKNPVTPYRDDELTGVIYTNE